ncbi:uncharacterized protein LOC141534568 isoform X2 [Cotesia typhae]|uniref:uncharacterized protein LOC141526526 isoform X2 n=1 Tax=Cotesia typhae TaxID=2053667 RepID=UPI003D69C4F1
MAARMFDFKGLRECLIDEITNNLEWDESEESDGELSFNLQDSHDTSNLDEIIQQDGTKYCEN